MSVPHHNCLDNDLSHLDHQCQSKFPDGFSHWFIPQSRVTELLTRSRIQEELKFNLESGSVIDDGIVDYIYTSAKLLFCITLSARLCGHGLYEAMRAFHQGGLRDSDLPISGKRYPELLVTRRNVITLTEHNLFRTPAWTNNERACRDFTTDQWKYLAPVFASDSVTLDLEDEHIMPFTEVSPMKQGTFGTVYQVTIHASHQETPLCKENGELATHALKELKASLVDGASEENKQLHQDWELEANALQDVKDLGHEHMIQVHAVIKKGQRQYFLFPWADMGSLQDYYTANLQPTVTHDLIHGILDQLLGLADAIHSLHNFNGNHGNNKESTESYRHGDLKPENILIFSDQKQKLVGKWRIADMGLAKHHVAPTGVRGLQPTSTRYGTRMYEPPEVVTRHKAARSRLYDIWSMGCIVLEMIVWLLYGYDELVSFNKSLKGSHLEVESPYWETGDNGKAQVHHRVRAFMKLISRDLESSRNQRNALGDLLKVVETKLLVVDLPPNRTTFYKKDEDHDTSPIIGTSTGNAPSADSTFNLSQPSHPSRSELPTMTFSQPEDESPMNDSLSYQESLEGFRCTAKDFHNAIQTILSECKMNKTYWDPGQRRNAIQVLRNTSLSPNATRGQAGLEAPVLSKNMVVPVSAGLFAEPPGKIDNLSKEWETPVDNVYAQDAFNGSPDLSQTVRASSDLKEVARLCEKCQKMELWKPNFHVSETRAELENMSSTCDFCRMRWNQCKRRGPIEATVHFSKVDSTLRLNERYPPVLALCRPPGFEEVDQVSSIQIGLPQLEAAGSDSHVAIMRHWLDDCDQKHFNCKLIGNQPSLPTRLIYVGHRDLAAPVLKLIETKNLQRMVHYLALSHPWGHGPFYCTYPDNLEQHKLGIDMEALPATFRDAVVITRRLGYSYLWIDSICIIQGPDGDFRQESKRMENVFSQAFCVLAASSALSQQSGFLRSHDGARRLGESRQILRLPLNGENPLYICDSIDRFDKDVLESGLNQRGWVLQERALARRTIYFTKTQTYFECGAGIRCETFTKMTNKLASFLGDPAFPKIAFESTRGGKILLCQDLYKQYSRLRFSKQQDRPDAIAGLEKRLIETLNVQGGFGIFNDPKHPGLLRRSLLWHRAVDECDSLEAINFAPRTCPPTWSWMMYKGGIEYCELPFDKVEWDDDVLSPWESAQAKWHSSDDTSSSLGLSVNARNFTWGITVSREEAMMVLDIPPQTDGPDPLMKCVVLGRLRGPPRKAHGTKHFVLFVTESKRRTAGRRRVLTRLGAGYLPGSWINLDEPGSLAELH